MKKLLFISLITIGLTGCFDPIPHSLDDIVVTKEDGTQMKIKWNEGNGNSWHFFYPVTVTTQAGVATTEWRRITE